MAKKNRQTLREKFRRGSMPSQDDFGDLIDSMMNIMDDGIEKSAPEGFKISQLGDTGNAPSRPYIDQAIVFRLVCRQFT